MLDGKFLYIEDDAVSRTVMEMMFKRRLGIKDYIIWENSENFAEKLNRIPFLPTIIFLDIHMKPIDGFQMLAILREHPEFQNLTIIALTASVMSEEIEQLQSAGFDGVIAKPIDADLFPQLVGRVLNGEKIWNITG